MSATISVRLDEETLKDLKKVVKTWHIDRSEAVRRLLHNSLQNWRTQENLRRLAAHEITVGQAAHKTGKSIWDILELGRQKNIDWTGYSNDDLEKDLEILEGK